jgi:hypothetical protein
MPVDIVRLPISYQFIRERVRMSWREIRFGLVNELLDPEAPIELAVDQVRELAEPPEALLELAGAGRGEPTLRLVEQLADGEPQRPENEIRDKWLYLALGWIYEHREENPDPLQRVEEVYADFGYPEQIAKFVRYMPMDGPDLGSREANERRLFERWARYLDEAARAHAP